MSDPFSLLGLLQEPYIAKGFGQKDFFNNTTLQFGGLAILAVCLCFALFLRRGHAILALILLQSVVPTSLRVIFAGLDWNFGRLLVIVGLLRIYIRGEHRGLAWTKLDKLILAWALVNLVVYTLRRGSTGAFIYRSGVTLETVGMYILARVWIRDSLDVDRIGKMIAWLSILAALLFLVEYRTTNNLYSVIGRVAATEVRDGRVRCVGPFEHSILAGAFWVSLLPWVAVGWWTRPAERPLTIAGVCSVLLIVFCSSSSTPIMGVAACMLGTAFYVLRHHMRIVRWAALFAVAGLHMVMNKPVWHLIARVGVVSGSTGYHRYRLIDAAVRHWNEWILLGSKSTAAWGWYLFDVTNQYVKEAVDGGGLGLLLFLAYMSAAYGCVGRLWRSGPQSTEWRARWWALGVSLFLQCVMFISIGITHAQQNFLAWILPVGALAGAWQFHDKRRHAVRAPQPPSRVRRRPVRLWHERNAERQASVPGTSRAVMSLD